MTTTELPAPEGGRRRVRAARARSTLAAAFARQTWAATGYLVLSPFVGALWGGLAVCLLIGSIAGMALVIGLPVLAGTLLLARVGARLERRWIEVALGERIAEAYWPVPRGEGAWRWMSSVMTDPQHWRDVLYLVLLLPLGIAWCAVAAAFWVGSIGLTVLPLLALVPNLTVSFTLSFGLAGWDVDIAGEAALLGALVGVPLLLLVTPALVRWMARAHLAVARALLGPTRAGKLAARNEALRSSRARAVEAAAAERRRIERDLHDGAQARLVSLAISLGMAREKFDAEPRAAQELLDEAHAEAKRAIAELRDLARGIHPAVLTDRGLDAALSALAGRSPIPVEVTVRLPDRPGPGLESIAYFVVAEALTNAAKHGAASRASVTVERVGELLVVEVNDDGGGGADPAGAGLRGLADRCVTVDGTLAVDSPRGGPTTIRAELPCES